MHVLPHIKLLMDVKVSLKMKRIRDFKHSLILFMSENPLNCKGFTLTIHFVSIPVTIVAEFFRGRMDSITFTL